MRHEYLYHFGQEGRCRTCGAALFVGRLCNIWGKTATCRASFGCTTPNGEIDTLIEALEIAAMISLLRLQTDL